MNTTEIAVISTKLDFISDQILEIKKFQKECPVHNIEIETNLNTVFRRVSLYVLGTIFIVAVGILAKAYS